MILVTGASGFVGGHLLKILRERLPGNSIRLFDIQRPLGVLPDSVEVFRGPVEDPECVTKAVRGAEVVIHLAGKVQPFSKELQEMFRVNVEGTNNVYAAAVKSGCRLFLHMSSAGIYGLPRGPNPFRESDTPNPVTPYQRTKWQAEEAIRHINARGTTLNILRPSGIYGPGSHLEIPTYKKVLRQRWAVELSGGIVVHPTHVRDVVEAILALLERPAPHGTVFNIGGEKQIVLRDFHGMVAETLGVQRRHFILPQTISRPLVRIAGPILSLVGRPNPLLQDLARGCILRSAVDDSRFRKLYPSVPIVPFKDGLREHIDWARAGRLL
jgi:nucleoside-diphosphate-sugar epimerase